ncbi:MAG TPA: acyltransferase domain-containing protein [Blastocatellia bacterium]|nr:acyltransferase domain-containing protein [Blastocatellia bacterium]
MSNPPIIFMFSGQGSQYFQMGQALYDKYPTFRHWMDRMDLRVRELSKHSVVDVLYHQGQPKAEAFDRTLLSHPAIFMTQYAMAQTLIEARIRPDLTLGVSLGTFVAATLAGCLEVEEALTAVVKHASILESSCERGAMIAVLAEPRLYDDSDLHRYSSLAAINFDSHFVVAAPAGQVAEIERILRDRRATFQRLPVSFAFHSPWIDAAEAPFKACLRSIKAGAAVMPLACCARSRLLDALPEDHLWQVTREPIRFQRTIQHLENEGPYQYVDLGPSGTLATFTKYVLPGASASRAHAIMTPYGRDLENLAAVTAKLAS